MVHGCGQGRGLAQHAICTGLRGFSAETMTAGSRWGRSIFLTCLAASFLAIFATHRELWRALIPGGVLPMTAVIAGLSSEAGGLSGAGMLFGMAATFALVTLLDTGQQHICGALISASIPGVLGAVILLQAATWSNMVIAIAVVAAGLSLLCPAVRSQTEE